MSQQIQGHIGLAQLDGNAINLGKGNVGTGTQRVAIAADQDPVPITHGAAISGGYTPGKLISANTTNATNIKNSAGTLGSLVVMNLNAAARYLKLYDKASAPTVGTDPPVQTYCIPGGSAGSGVCIPLPPQGLAFANGISFATTTGIADADTGAVAAAEMVVNYGIK